MAIIVDMNRAKECFSSLFDRVVEEGEEVVITVAGIPMTKSVHDKVEPGSDPVIEGKSEE